MSSADSCPCGRDRPFTDCCEPHIRGDHPAATAEDLMRSRYSAFVNMDEAYLKATWHPRSRPSRVRLDADLKWLGLRIKSTQLGGEADTEGTVEFVARCRRSGKAQRLHETSRFEKVDGRWFYLDGTHH